jgi:hypothetical protein
MAVTAWTLPGSVATGGTGVAWGSITNALTDGTDDALAIIISQSTNELRFSNFNFASLIPSGAIIDGIEVRTKVYHTSAGSDIFDDVLSLFASGAGVGANKASLTEWPIFTGGSAVVTTRDYGGATDKWSLTPTYADVTATGFGFLVKAKETAGLSNAARIQVGWMRIHYHMAYSATGALDNAALTMDASATDIAKATAALSSHPVTLHGVGVDTGKASGGIALAATELSGTGTSDSGAATIAATGELVVGELTLSAVGKMIRRAVGAIALPALRVVSRQDLIEPAVPEYNFSAALREHLMVDPLLAHKLSTWNFGAGEKPSIHLSPTPPPEAASPLMLIGESTSAEAQQRSNRYDKSEAMSVMVRVFGANLESDAAAAGISQRVYDLLFSRSKHPLLSMAGWTIVRTDATLPQRIVDELGMPGFVITVEIIASRNQEGV